MPSKQQLRKYFRDKRKSLIQSYREAAAEKAAEVLVAQAIFQKSEKIACYLPFQDECQTHAIIESIWQAQKKCYLPVLTEPGNKMLSFIRYENGDLLQANRFGILEPKLQKEVIEGRALELVIAPLIAFDKQGVRLGTGGGFYDFTFAFKVEKAQETPFFMGLAFAIQTCDTLPHEPWDITLNGVLTENGCEYFSV